VLTVLADVENALIAYADKQIRHQPQVAASLAAGRAAEFAQNQDTSGGTDLQSVLNAQSEGAVTSNLLRLYKSLRGGWKSRGPALENLVL